MIKERLLIHSKIGLFLDIIFTVVAFYLAYLLRAFVIPLPENAPFEFVSISWLLFIIIPVWFVLLSNENAYITIERKPRDTYLPVIRAVFFGTLILLAAIFIMKAITQSRLFVILFATLDTILLLSLRIWIFPAFASRESKGVLILGSKEDRDFVKVFLSYSPFKFHIKEFRDDTKHFNKLISDWMDWVIIASTPEKFSRYENVVQSCREMGIPVSYAINEKHTFMRTRFDIESYNGLSILTLSTAPEVSIFLIVKYALDSLISLLLLLLLFPLLTIISFFIKLESKGPIIFKQTRCGLNGKIFNLYKFRTMVEKADEIKDNYLDLNVMDRVVFKMKDDPRITRVGKLLRRLSFDELPQLINCIKGDMSLVGPRPPILEEVHNYTLQERRRLSMKPGLTCLWQISGRNEIDFDRWMELDLEYIDNWSPLLDVKLLLFTIPAIISGRGAY
ncbi:exopolysaccharide biosynthesis polyprenyl glycosylphosphotransferase [candidate division WOR-3 bacterium]|nr:exopolysaccharide biosynthesis polyprenyl glycosylphosphotransferase [candidate division WOR-3 bacterium]